MEALQSAPWWAWLPLAVPAAFLVLFVVMLVLQRRVDRQFRDTMRAMDAELAYGFARARTGVALLSDPTFVPDGKVVEIGPGYVVIQKPDGEHVTTIVGTSDAT